MTQITKVGTDTTLITPTDAKIIALYPSKEHCTVAGLSAKVISDVTALSATKIADGSVSSTEFQYLD